MKSDIMNIMERNGHMKEGITGNKGFTIVELLTVMSVIAVLIGLLVPALNLVKDFSKQVQQQAQFHSIDAALEMFSADFGYYPESNDNAYAANPHPDDSTPYCGSNKLAEALVGKDYLGFHPNSDFRADGLNYVINNLGVRIGPVEIYHADTDITDWESASENIKARKGPYIEFENANAFTMGEIYSDLDSGTGTFDADSLALCDVFAKKRTNAVTTTSTTKKTGMPILYYRARTQFTRQNSITLTELDLPASTPTYADDIYFYPDNDSITALGTPEDPTIYHPLNAGGNGYTDVANLTLFDNMILNKQVTAIRRPYRAGSYILMSAGQDGLYGTSDDVFNFTREAQ